MRLEAAAGGFSWFQANSGAARLICLAPEIPPTADEDRISGSHPTNGSRAAFAAAALVTRRGLSSGRAAAHKLHMPVSGALERYWVRPGDRPDLSRIESNEKSLFTGADKSEFEGQFRKLQDELRDMQKMLYAQNKHRVLVVMQAMDTGGKDGCIKHVFSHIDPQGIHVHSFKKPTVEELSHDFLWRVHARVPRTGQLVIFNRSHYEDVIAVRVKKLFPAEVWKRRQRHIVDFERMLAEEGTTIVKIYLHISKEEQKRRLESRLVNPVKHWKFNPDDLADRKLWHDFMEAYEDLIAKTSTAHAPWFVVPADRKWYRNLCVARIMVDTLRKLDMELPAIDWNPKDIVIDD
jgi:PPK2 family polyphosphate:nucleotide phosphotransferase